MSVVGMYVPVMLSLETGTENFDKTCCGNLCGKKSSQDVNLHLFWKVQQVWTDGWRSSFVSVLAWYWFLQTEFSSSSPKMSLLGIAAEHHCSLHHLTNSSPGYKYLNLQWETMRFPIISESQAVEAGITVILVIKACLLSHLRSTGINQQQLQWHEKNQNDIVWDRNGASRTALPAAALPQGDSLAPWCGREGTSAHLPLPEAVTASDSWDGKA